MDWFILCQDNIRAVFNIWYCYIIFIIKAIVLLHVDITIQFTWHQIQSNCVVKCKVSKKHKIRNIGYADQTHLPISTKMSWSRYSFIYFSVWNSMVYWWIKRLSYFKRTLQSCYPIFTASNITNQKAFMELRAENIGQLFTSTISVCRVVSRVMILV